MLRRIILVFLGCGKWALSVLLIFSFYTSVGQKKGRHYISELNALDIKKGNRVIAITGATIFDGNGGTPLENGTVVVTNGIITAVGPAAKIRIAPDATIVQAAGMSLLPGFIDAHFHLDDNPGLPTKFLHNGVTSVRDPGLWIEVYDGERKSGRPLPRLFLSGPHIDMFPPAYPADAFVVRDAPEAVRQVNAMADQGSTVIKVYFRLPPSIIAAVCKAAHDRGLPVTAHLEITEAMEAIEAGVDGIEHITSLGLSLVPKFTGEKYRQKVLGDNNARRDGRYEVWKDVDINGHYADSLANFLREHKTFISSTLAVFEYRFPTNDEKKDSSKLSGFTKMKNFAGILKKKGVRMVVGSHSMVPYAETGWAYQREMELMVEGGMSPSEVIVAATMENARFFRIDDRLGSIEKGKIADLVLIKGNPLDNISNVRNIHKVMLNGEWVRE